MGGKQGNGEGSGASGVCSTLCALRPRLLLLLVRPCQGRGENRKNASRELNSTVFAFLLRLPFVMSETAKYRGITMTSASATTFFYTVQMASQGFLVRVPDYLTSWSVYYTYFYVHRRGNLPVESTTHGGNRGWLLFPPSTAAVTAPQGRHQQPAIKQRTHLLVTQGVALLTHFWRQFWFFSKRVCSKTVHLVLLAGKFRIENRPSKLAKANVSHPPKMTFPQLYELFLLGFFGLSSYSSSSSPSPSS